MTEDQEQKSEIEFIRAALIKAVSRGVSSRMPEDIKLAVQKRLLDNGRL